MYCLPIVKARLLVADAIRLRYADSLLQTQSARIALLADEKQSLISSYSNLLKKAEEKTQYQKEITSRMEGLAMSYRDQMNYYQQQDRKHRRQNKLLAGLAILVAGLAIVR